MDAFDIYGPLPTGTTVLEASAGTGKTFTVGALVARYVAEGVATLDQMLVITFGRAASQELRERVRQQLVEVERGLTDVAAARAAEGLVGFLAGGVDDAEVGMRRKRLGDALAAFDAATIATTHQFCQLVLRSLGVAGDTDSGATLVESLDELVVEVVDDLYLERFGHLADKPPFKRDVALMVARAAVDDPQARLVPDDAEPGSVAGARVRFAIDVQAEVDRRKRRLGVLSYDDLLSRLATALEPVDAPARERMRQRWKVVLVDEFQDTDPVQWQVLDRAFSEVATLVLIGDPKQAIYAFRGGDIVTYLEAAETAGTKQTLATNWRSDAPLVDALQVLTRGAALGDPRITVHEVEAHHQGSRFAGLEQPAPFRMRVVRAEDLGTGGKGTIPMDRLRAHIADDLAGDIAGLLAGGATYDGDSGVRAVEAGDVAILLFSLTNVQQIRDALAGRGIPSVVTGGSSVLLSQAGDEWLALLEALEQPQRSNRVRSAALTAFFGETPASLDAGGDLLTDAVAHRVRSWLDLWRSRGVAAVFEAAVTAGLGARVLSRPDGERLLTDLNHLAQLLHDIVHRERFGLTALLEWLRSERRAAAAGTERTRRLDTDASAVQIVTVHGSKGLQYPVVYVPHLFDRWIPEESVHLFHDDAGRRALDVGGAGAGSPGARAALAEGAGEHLRLTYVALTRAQSQLVAWWAPSWNAGNAGLTRLLFGRARGEASVPDVVAQGPPDGEVATVLDRWADAGAFTLEHSEVRAATAPPSTGPAGTLDVRRFTRGVDTAWQRTSYSGLIRAEEKLATPGVDSEPEVAGTVDEEGSGDDPVVVSAAEAHETSGDLVSPMADLPAGATFGSLVHGVLEHADPQAADLRAELRARVVEQLRWWSVEATPDALAEGLVPMQHTSLGPLAGGSRLVDIGAGDRLCELDFEFPLVGGDHPETGAAEVTLGQVSDVLRRHLPADDPMRGYAERLESPSLGGQRLRGYLSGSIDVVLRVPDGEGRRYLVVDYKTNLLGVPGQPVTALDYRPGAMADAMLHSHYPLQALLYSVVLHRYLRWRLADYDPERHLGGILYLYVRGMAGPDTPEVDGNPCGVFSWRPPAAMIEELSGLLDGRLAAGAGVLP
jgi:exodeoxyribonuclease V beta subunit